MSEKELLQSMLGKVFNHYRNICQSYEPETAKQHAKQFSKFNQFDAVETETFVKLFGKEPRR